MKEYTVLIEQDYAENNFTAYVPELRVSAVGDTKEELLANLEDVIAIEEERSKKAPAYEFSIRSFVFKKGGE